MLETITKIYENGVFIQKVTGILGKKSECSYQQSNLRPSITCLVALPLSYRSLVGAKAVKPQMVGIKI